LGIPAEEAAEAIIVIASEHMRGLINEMTTGQGIDVRECLMVAGGGAAGLNIVRIARESSVAHIVIPRLAAGLSAVGGLYSDITAMFSRGHFTVTDSFDYVGVDAVLRELGGEVDAFLQRVGSGGERRRLFQCEARYSQQLSEIDVDLGASGALSGEDDLAHLQQAFDQRHLDLFSVNQPGEPLEVTTWRAEARVVRPKRLLALPQPPTRPVDVQPAAHRTAWFDGRATTTPIYFGHDLPVGVRIYGPALIEEPTTTIVVIPGSAVTARESHYLVDVGS
jgi:N-methylhydantoinase A